MLGYKTHADYQLEVRMSKNAAAVYDMFDKLIPRSVFPDLHVEYALQARAGDACGCVDAWMRGCVDAWMRGCARGDRHADSRHALLNA